MEENKAKGGPVGPDCKLIVGGCCDHGLFIPTDGGEGIPIQDIKIVVGYDLEDITTIVVPKIRGKIVAFKGGAHAKRGFTTK